MHCFKALVLTFLFPLSLPAATTNVILGPGSAYNPNSITVNVGDTVHWDNSTGTQGFHNVAPNCCGEPTANGQGLGWTYDYQFDNPGAFTYFCQVHGGGMSGVVNVAPVGSFTSTRTPTPTMTPTITVTFTGTISPTFSATDTITPGPSPTHSETSTISPTFSESPTATETSTVTLSFTFSPSPTATPTRTPVGSFTPTLTPGTPPIQIFEKAPELLLAPNPLKVGETVCLYSKDSPAEGRWDIYNTALQRVAHLSFSGPALQCWDTKALAPGLYYVNVEWILPDAKVKRLKQKVVLWR